MSATDFLASSNEEFQSVRSAAGRVVNLDATLPAWPFSTGDGVVDICDYTMCLGDLFEPVIESLAGLHGDTSISFIMIRPEPTQQFARRAGFFPAFTLPVEQLSGSYSELLWYTPEGIAAEMAFAADAFVLFGSSERWTVWGERDWGVALLRSVAGHRSWREYDVPFMDDPREAAIEMIQASLGDGRLPDHFIEQFEQSVRGGGS